MTKIRCERCHGHGTTIKRFRCTDCNGTGQIKAGMGYSYPNFKIICKRCKGKGILKERCSSCEGTGYYKLKETKAQKYGKRRRW